LAGIGECCGSGVREISEYIFAFVPEHPTNAIARQVAKTILDLLIVISIASSGLAPEGLTRQEIEGSCQ
jgi:hypothetical protein